MFEGLIRRRALFRILIYILSPRLKALIVKGVNALRKGQLEKIHAPESIVIFVTNRCQFKCSFCFFKSNLNVQEMSLTLDEIVMISKRLRFPARVILTGGEPFLRKDIEKICIALNKYAGVRYINICTNGFLPKDIKDKVGSVLYKTNLKLLKIQISLHAMGGQHDDICGVEGAFENAVKTLNILKEMQRKHPNLYVEVATVVNPILISHIEEFVDFLKPLRFPIKFSIGRKADGSGFYEFNECGSNSLVLDDLESFRRKIVILNERSEFKFLDQFQKMKFMKCIEILRSGQRILPCYAGSLDAVIYSNANVAFCENISPIANLRDYEYDLKSIWNSEDAKKMRQEIVKCHCINGCNLITAMSYDDKVLLQIMGCESGF